MNIVKNTIKFFFLLANVIVGLCFLFCAYSPAISPVNHPVMACAGMFIPIFIILNLGLLLFWCITGIKMTLVPIVFFLCGWSALMSYSPINFSSEDYSGDKLKILTYNVMQMNGEKNNNKGNSILQYIKDSKADIVCLQEFPYKNTNLWKQLQKHYPYIRTCNFNKVNAVACLSKYPITSTKEIKLGSSFNGSAIFKIKYKGRSIPVIVNHLESNKLTSYDKEVYKELLKSPDEEHVKDGGKYLLGKLADAMSIRGRQADIIAGYIEKNYSPYMIVCGDFNDTPISYTHNKISERLTDAFIEKGNGPGITYNRNMLLFRIDHIMAADSYKIIECKVDNSIDASDHYPVYCVLGVNN